jgi:flagellar hook capping protein FlgD
MNRCCGLFLSNLMLLAICAGTGYAGPSLTPKVLLHVSSATSKSMTICSSWSPNSKGIPCSDYVVEGPIGQNLLAYIVVAQVDTPLAPGIRGVALGLEYNGNNGEGVDVAGWRLCGDLEFPNQWPLSGGGNVVTWLGCQNTRIGSDGIHTIVGALDLYAYSADQLKITPNRKLGIPVLALADCDARQVNLDSTAASGWAGFGMPGRNTCVACEAIPVDAMDVDPNTLNGASQGNYVTAHIELSPGHDPSLVEPISIRLNGSVSASPEFFEIGDWNENGVPDFMVKFPRAEVEAVLSEGDQVPVTITGTIDNCPFSGTHMVRVIRPRLVRPNGGESYLAGSRALVEWENPSGWTVDYAQIYYSSDGGDSWAQVGDHVFGESYVWAVPQELTEAGRLRVVLVDAEGTMGYDSTDGPFTVRSATGIGDSHPMAVRFYPSAPNPFRGATKATFDLPEPVRVTIKVFDLGGRVVRVLADEAFPAGTHSVSWNARDASGDPVSAGIYFMHVQAGSFAGTQRMYLQK